MIIREAKVALSIREGSPLDGESLRQTYLGEIFAYASRRLARREDAEDATAETFQAALSHPNRRVEDPRLWLYAIARRQVAMVARRNRRRREVPLTDRLEGAAQPNPEQAEARGEMRRLVLALPDDQREALMLQYLEDLDHKQIAVVMGKSPAAINGLLQRARARIFREGKGYFEPPVQTEFDTQSEPKKETR